MLRISACVVLIPALWTPSSTAAPGALPQVGLGGSPEAFKTRFGTPVRDMGELVDFRKCPGKTALAEWTVSFDRGKAVSITRKACPPASLDERSAKSEARSFFPGDAKATKAFSTTDGCRRSSITAQRCRGHFPPAPSAAASER